MWHSFIIKLLFYLLDNKSVIVNIKLNAICFDILFMLNVLFVLIENIKNQRYFESVIKIIQNTYFYLLDNISVKRYNIIAKVII